MRLMIAGATAILLALTHSLMSFPTVQASHRGFKEPECTWWVDIRAQQIGWHLQFRRNSGRDARLWWDLVIAPRGDSPRAQSIMVLNQWPGNPGNPLGHLGFVETVDSSNRWTISHSNWPIDSRPRRSIVERVGRHVRIDGQGLYPLLGFLYNPVSAAPAPLPSRVSYDYGYVSQSGYPTIPRGGSARFILTLRNTGPSVWYKHGTSSTPFNLGTDRPRDRVPGFVREDAIGRSPSGWVAPNRVALQETTVPPGGTGTFVFWMSADMNKQPGTYREYFRPVVDGVSWLKDFGIYWDTVTPDSAAGGTYHAQYVDQNGYPSLAPGYSYQFVVRFRNMGTATWTPDVVHLGTDRPRDRVPGFIREGRCSGNPPSGWIAPNRVRMQESAVPPGGVATLSFWYTVPKDHALGTFREYFRPVADGITWMEDFGVYWDITVRAGLPCTQW